MIHNLLDPVYMGGHIEAVKTSAFHWFWDPQGKWVIFWGGFGSCLSEFAILGVVWKHLNCNTKGCWRIGRHHVEGTPYKVCRRCHPTVPTAGASLAQIHGAHRWARDNKEKTHEHQS